MNKVILMGRLVKAPETRYSTGDNAIVLSRYTLAVNRRYKKKGDAEVDFINCVTFGKQAEFAEKYLQKGQLISICGRLQVSQWTDQEARKRYSTDVVVEEHYFAESKNASNATKETGKQSKVYATGGFYPIDETIEDDDLPF